MIRYPVAVYTNIRYSSTWTDGYEGNLRIVMSVYCNSYRLESWANGSKNREYFLGVL